MFISRDLEEKEVRKVLDDCLVLEDIMPNYEGVFKDIGDPFKTNYLNEWRHAITAFDQQGLML